ncbi:hypothetical protein [Azospirillum endophyticum]
MPVPIQTPCQTPRMAVSRARPGKRPDYGAFRSQTAGNFCPIAARLDRMLRLIHLQCARLRILYCKRLHGS